MLHNGARLSNLLHCNMYLMNILDSHFATAQPSLERGQIPLRGADLPLLVSLDALLEECNVTRAASRLHMSQPALSAQLSRLRQLFDDPLLVPAGNGRGLVPSQYALNLHRRLKPALTTLSVAIQPNAERFQPETDSRCFTIAATNTSAAMIVPALLNKLQAYGNRELKFLTVEPDFGKLASQLEKGEIDLCLSPACMLPPGLCVSDLLSTPHVLAQRRGHPRGTTPVTLDEYCNVLDHVNVGRMTSLHGYIDEQLYRMGRTRQVAIGVKDFSYVPALLKSTDMVCTLPAHLLAALNVDLESRELTFPLSMYALCMAWHPRCEDDPSFLWLRHCLDELRTTLVAQGELDAPR
jgi:DNA-binding transcriptional LysR family regulator